MHLGLSVGYERDDRSWSTRLAEAELHVMQHIHPFVVGLEAKPELQPPPLPAAPHAGARTWRPRPGRGRDRAAGDQGSGILFSHGVRRLRVRLVCL
eukprot:366052-Chlamydomonas_euryale.AAC.17